MYYLIHDCSTQVKRMQQIFLENGVWLHWLSPMGEVREVSEYDDKEIRYDPETFLNNISELRDLNKDTLLISLALNPEEHRDAINMLKYGTNFESKTAARIIAGLDCKEIILTSALNELLLYSRECLKLDVPTSKLQNIKQVSTIYPTFHSVLNTIE